VFNYRKYWVPNKYIGQIVRKRLKMGTYKSNQYINFQIKDPGPQKVEKGAIWGKLKNIYTDLTIFTEKTTDSRAKHT
jgi:hypothetical protein